MRPSKAKRSALRNWKDCNDVWLPPTPGSSTCDFQGRSFTFHVKGELVAAICLRAPRDPLIVAVQEGVTETVYDLQHELPIYFSVNADLTYTVIGNYEVNTVSTLVFFHEYFYIHEGKPFLSLGAGPDHTH